MKPVKLKLIAVLVVASVCLAVIVACNTTTTVPTSGPASLKSSRATPDGINPPHAVDTAGKALPESSTTMPDKPLILAKDSTDPKWGEHKSDAPFDHVKHSTNASHSADGKTVTACVECHHTEQPSAPAGQEYLRRFDRKEALTAKQLEDSKQAVKSCRACHFQAASEETDEFPPKSVTYPPKTGRPPSGKLTNNVAYHTNCISCHEVAKKRDKNLTAPDTCVGCHVNKKLKP